MKLATIDDGTPDGKLVVVSRCLGHALASTNVPSMRCAAEQWDDVYSELSRLSEEVNSGGRALPVLDHRQLRAPFPRLFQAFYASAYGNRAQRLQQQASADCTPPLIYQGRSDLFLPPHADIPLVDAEADLDVEAELAVIARPLPRGAGKAQCAEAIILAVMLCDFTYRKLIPQERQGGFGFVRSKPHCSCAPIAVTLDEPELRWNGARAYPTVSVAINGDSLGEVTAGTHMEFGFDELLEVVCSYRPLAEVSLMSSGTIADAEGNAHCSIIEARGAQLARHGAATRAFLRSGDRVQIDASEQGRSVFGTIEHSIAAGVSRDVGTTAARA